MKTEWDYTLLAPHYDQRADYDRKAIDTLLSVVGVQTGETVADIGAGTGKLATLLLDAGLRVKAVEPNDKMRSYGIKNTQGREIDWLDACGEHTTLPDQGFDLVTFGSSFNVLDQSRALQETFRVLKPSRWFACMWNHRDLSDPIQERVEKIIRKHIPQYSLGKRRENQTDIINKSGLFDSVQYIEGSFNHRTRTTDYVDAWRSHATVQRQSKELFDTIISEIQAAIPKSEFIEVPFTTRIWCAKKAA